jgi:chorismate mutase/prephenate dehydratase
MIHEEIDELRQQIDAIDDSLVELIDQRAKLAQQIKIAKRGPVYRPSREANILRRITKNNKTPLSDLTLTAIFRQIIGACRNLEQPLRVAYLGPEGTYSHAAATKLFGESSQFLPHNSLTKVVDMVERSDADIGILPFENSSEGSVTETHRLLLSTSLHVIGEYTMPIVHALLSNATSLSKIRTVYAHPQALGQCRNWLQANLPHAILVGESSTAEAAKRVARQNTTAAIASSVNADMYNLQVIADHIQDIPDNKTRFIMLGKFRTEPTQHDKTSIICTVRDKPGALHELLGIIAKHNVSMTRLESQPHPDHMYAFYIDMEGHTDTDKLNKMLKELDGTAKTCKILGSYPRE